MLDILLFLILSTVIVLGGIVTITRKQPLASALSLVVSFVALSGLYALLSAQLIAILQILVYAGAIIALIVFVIMLLNVRDEDLKLDEDRIGQVGIALLALFPFVSVVIGAILQVPDGAFPALASADFGSIEAVGMFLYRNYAFVFELVSVLLTVALVGVVLLAKRRI
jgi:NADH-quinone oxidoreductase subunit J